MLPCPVGKLYIFPIKGRQERLESPQFAQFLATQGAGTACERKRIKRVIWASSLLAIGNIVSLMGLLEPHSELSEFARRVQYQTISCEGLQSDAEDTFFAEVRDNRQEKILVYDHVIPEKDNHIKAAG